MESTALSSTAAPAADESLVATNGDDVRRPSPKSVASNNATNFNDKSATNRANRTRMPPSLPLPMPTLVMPTRKMK